MLRSIWSEMALNPKYYSAIIGVNGVAESMNGVLSDIARPLLSSLEIPELNVETIDVNIKFHNRLASSSLPDKLSLHRS